MQLKSFGCSLIYGNELSDSGKDASGLTWPALLAKKFKLEYECDAGGGLGNLMIMDRLTTAIQRNPNNLFVIQWTYLDRFDYSDPCGQHFKKTSLNDYLAALPNNTSPVDQFYFQHFHSEFRDKITSLVYMKTALDFLLEKKCKFVMTCLDDLIWCDHYHVSPAMLNWQRYLRSHSTFFDGKNFLDWCRDRGYKISPQGHPLEEAHATAADLMTPIIDAILHRA